MPTIDIATDPVLAKALAAREIESLDDIERTEEGGVFLHPTFDLPLIDIDMLSYPTWLRITWRVAGREVRYELDPQGAIITIADTQFPDAALHSFKGKRASHIIDLPGFECLLVDEAVLSSAFVSDPLDLRMSVVPRDSDGGEEKK